MARAAVSAKPAGTGLAARPAPKDFQAWPRKGRQARTPAARKHFIICQMDQGHADIQDARHGTVRCGGALHYVCVHSARDTKAAVTAWLGAQSRLWPNAAPAASPVCPLKCRIWHATLGVCPKLFGVVFYGLSMHEINRQGRDGQRHDARNAKRCRKNWTIWRIAKEEHGQCSSDDLGQYSQRDRKRLDALPISQSCPASGPKGGQTAGRPRPCWLALPGLGMPINTPWVYGLPLARACKH